MSEKKYPKDVSEIDMDWLVSAPGIHGKISRDNWDRWSNTDEDRLYLKKEALYGQDGDPYIDLKDEEVLDMENSSNLYYEENENTIFIAIKDTNGDWKAIAYIKK